MDIIKNVGRGLAGVGIVGLGVTFGVAVYAIYGVSVASEAMYRGLCGDSFDEICDRVVEKFKEM